MATMPKLMQSISPPSTANSHPSFPLLLDAAAAAFLISRRSFIIASSLVALSSSSAAAAAALAQPPSKSFLSGIANTKSWFQFYGDGFSIRVPPNFQDITEPKDYNAGLSLYGDKAKPKTCAARFATPDGSEVLSVVIRPSNQLKITFLEAQDIADLGSLKEAAKIFVPVGATLYSARTFKIKEEEGYRSGCEEKHDVYDFGVILLEMIVGRAINSPNDINISKDILSVSLTADLIARRSIVDPVVHKECSDESLKTLMELCLRCLSNEPHERPSMEDVVWNLQFTAQVEDTWRRDSTSNQSSPCQSHAMPAENI